MNRDSKTLRLSIKATVVLVLLSGMFLAAAPAPAQWQPSGNDIYYNQGKVGVGLTDPKGTLHIKGPLYFGDTVTGTKHSTIYAMHYNASEEPVLLLWSINNTTDNLLRIGTNHPNYNAPTKIEFYTAPTTTTLGGSRQMVINGAGNVGIGADAPSEKLEVTGNLKLSGDVLSSDNEIQLKNTSTGAVVKLLANGDVCIGSGCP